MNLKIILMLVAISIITATAGAKTIEVCSMCGNTTISEALGFAVDGDLISLQSDLLIDNIQVIDKAVTIEGGGYKINASLPRYGTAIKLTKPSVVNNFSLVMTRFLGTAFEVENMNDIVWNNINISAIENQGICLDGGMVLSNFGGCKEIGNSAEGSAVGILILNTTNFTVQNYTATNIGAFATRSSQKVNINGNFGADKINHIADAQWGAVFIDDDSDSVIINANITGYPIAVRGAIYQQNVFTTSNITLNSKSIKKNSYGIRGGFKGLTVQGTILDNTFDSLIWGGIYKFINVSTNSTIILPNATNLTASKWTLNQITIGNKTYNTSAGYNITASFNGSPPYTIDIAYNKTAIQVLNINISTLKVYHQLDSTYEILTPETIDTVSGIIRVETKTFSPFVVFGEPYAPEATPVPSSPTSSSGGGGGGSGGGGVVTDEDFANVNNYQSIDGNLLAGKEVRYDFNKVGTGIFYAIITGKENEYDVTIRVENLKTQSKKATTPAPNTVYLYTNILSGSQRMASAKIGFKVPNAWVDSNKIDPSTVKMYRLQDGNWNALDTKLVGSDAENSIYEAVTSGFSKFAITGEVRTQVLAVVETTVNPPISIPTPTPTTAQETPKATSGFELALGAISLISIYLLHKNRR